MGLYYDFTDADGFATGAIGRPGERTFYVQIRGDGRTITAKCEKAQVAELARYMRGMLSDLPEQPAIELASASLESPVEQDFVLGSIGLGIDRASSRMVIQLEEMAFIDDADGDDIDDELLEMLEADDDDSSTVVRVLLTAAQASAFCAMAEQVVSAGRETCQWCGSPKDPAGHACPRFN